MSAALGDRVSQRLQAKRIDTPAGTVTVQAPKTADHAGQPFYPQSLEAAAAQCAP